MLPVLLATVLSLPPKLAEAPVSSGAITRAALIQMSPKLASNGSLAMAIWTDLGTSAGRVIASRIAGDGTPLDPLGILVADRATARDVVWNGDGFTAVVVIDAAYTALVDIDRDGNVGPLRRLDTYGYYAAHTNEGASTRMLFLPRAGAGTSGGIVDLAGNAVRSVEPSPIGSFVLAAWNGREFLVLRDLTTADTIDRDGNMISSGPSNLVPGTLGIIGMLTGDTRGGFALINSDVHGEVTEWHLDERGTLEGHRTIQPPPANHYTMSNVFAQPSRDGYAASWVETTTDMRSTTFVSRHGTEPSTGMQWTGTGAAFVEPEMNLTAIAFDDAFTTTGDDIAVQAGTSTPQMLTRSAPLQKNAAIAGGANGFLAAWVENSGTDGRIFVRRFTTSGTPQGEPLLAGTVPVLVESYVAAPNVSIASGSDMYLVTWGTSARRLDANKGEWLDDAPFTIAGAAIRTVAAAGDTALVITLGGPDAVGARAQRIELRGNPSGAPIVPIAGAFTADFEIASNGNDYLLVWIDNLHDCPLSEFGCQPVPARVVAQRLRADGTAIDATPIVISAPASGQPRLPSVAWNGERYLVAWRTAAVHDIAAAYVSSEGAVEQLGIVDSESEPSFMLAPEVVGYGGDFVLVSHVRPTSAPSRMIFRTRFIGGPSTTIEVNADDPTPTFDAAANGGTLMFAYDRVDHANGHVIRVFLEPHAFGSRRRIAH